MKSYALVGDPGVMVEQHIFWNERKGRLLCVEMLLELCQRIHWLGVQKEGPTQLISALS